MAKRSGSTIVFRGAAANEFVNALRSNGVRRCRFCQCTDTRACAGGCSWVGDHLCSACEPSAEQTITALCLVSGTDHISDDQVRALTADQRADAFAWAMAVHYKASDNPGVKVPARPDFTLPPTSPAPEVRS